MKNKLVKNSLFLLCILLGVLNFASSAFAGAPAGIESESGATPLWKKGEVLYRHYCIHCHGKEGGGDGFNAEFLDKEPAELSDINFIRKKDNRQIFRVIKFGGVGVRKSHLMPVFGFTFSERQIWSLVAYVRKLAGDDNNKVELPPEAEENRPTIEPVTTLDRDRILELYRDEKSRNALIQLGEHLFFKKKSCFACHSVDDEGGKVGPDLSRAGYLYNPEWLYIWVHDPQRVKPNTKMPNLGLNEKEAAAIAFFLSILKGESEDPLEEWEELKIFLEGKGNAQNGEALFFDAKGKAGCAKCHTVQGKGGGVGPNLSFVGSSRTPHFLLESIIEPNSVITVGFNSSVVVTKTGEVVKGIKKKESDEFVEIVDGEGSAKKIDKKDIEKIEIEEDSLMPKDFKDRLSDQEIRDVLAFLESLKIPLKEESTAGK